MQSVGLCIHVNKNPAWLMMKPVAETVENAKVFCGIFFLNVQCKETYYLYNIGSNRAYLGVLPESASDLRMPE